jgi:ubiquinone/menaquinone biosynthesis C-methylase UbiE
VASAFTKQSGHFDEYFSGNTIIQYKRKRVRDLVMSYLDSPGEILELNSGTGEDAIWFAEQGHQVHATDLSPGMQEVLKKKVRAKGLENMISSECCSFANLRCLRKKGPYDLIFSNFAGLNCTGNLDASLLDFKDLLNPKGLVILAILPKFCLWEVALLFRGKFKTAFRRFFSKRGVTARVEASDFICWYYNPSYITKTLGDDFHLLHLEGLCSLVPPSYLEGFPEKHPGLYQYLKKREDQLKDKWPWKYIGDYYLIVLQKKD